MAKIKYSRELDPEISSRAIGYELHVSPKHSYEICREIRRKNVSDAKRYLKEVIELKKAVPFKRYNMDIGHKKGSLGPGRYPQKAAREILKLIESAEANAEYKGLESEKMRIIHIATHRGRVIKGMIPRAFGRATANNTPTATIEIILESWA